MLKYVGFVCLFSAVAAQAAEVPPVPAVPRPVRGALVSCNSGQSIQAAVNASVPPAEITIAGICVENVLIRDKDISLRGIQSPSLDGIRSPVPGVPALVVRGSVIASITGLSFSENPGPGAAIRDGANMTVASCRFENNAASGLRIDSGAFVLANDSTFAGNGGPAASTADAQFFCISCDVSAIGPAVVATRGSIVSLLDSVVTGAQGLVAQDRGSAADLDCVTRVTTHACSMNVSQFAALGLAGGTASLIGAGDFSGQIVADDRGTVRLDGARQIATTPGGAPNVADTLGEIIVAPQSLLLGAEAAHFARVLFMEDSVLKGSIRCSGAADAFLDPAVTIVPGSTVSGCEHASVP